MSALDAANQAISGYLSSITDIQSRASDVISELDLLLSQHESPRIDKFLDDQSAQLKDFLGADAANFCSDDDDEQDAAISLCEEWVAENVSNAGMTARILCALDVNGVEDGVSMIKRAVANLNKSPSP